MTKTKKNFKSIFKTFALAFTTLALMLGVFLGNALPKVQAEEADELTRYYTAEKIEEIKISQVNFEDTEFYNKHILCDITAIVEESGEKEEEIAFFAIDMMKLGTSEYSSEEITSDSQFTLVTENNIVYDTYNESINSPDSGLDNLDLKNIEYTYKYFIAGDGHEYVYLYINDCEYFDTDTFVIIEGNSWYISEAIEVPEEVEPDEPTIEPDEPTVEPDEPTVEPDEPTVEPDEPTVEPDEPTDDNNQEDNSSDVVEEEKDGFVEMLGNTSIVVFGLENISAFTAGIATLGAVALFIIVSAVVIAIIWVSKKR